MLEHSSWKSFSALLLLLGFVSGHGRLEEPPARNAAWRYGFHVPANYDDVGLNCGGLSVQKSNGGKCGVCGDAFSARRDHETGGKYATNTIVREYLQGALIDVKILLSANHKGFMELRLCPTTNDLFEVTQECLNANLLLIEGFGFQYPVNENADQIYFRAQLPTSLTCSRCVLQWRYHAGNNWGRNVETGQACMGCGPQEEFYNCADIRISEGILPSTPSIDLRPVLPTAPWQSLASTTIVPQNFYPLELLTKTIKNLRCLPTNDALKDLLGIEHWCLQLCAIHCPPSLCFCFRREKNRFFVIMVDVQRTTVSNDRGPEKTSIDERFGTRISYQFLINHLELEKAELTEPKDEQLIRRLNMCNALFKGVQTAREGVLDAVALKTISSFARIQTKAIDGRTSTEDAFSLMRKCARILHVKSNETDDVFGDFYLHFQRCHKVVPTMNFMSNRLPTNWFERRQLEKSLVKERAPRTRNIFDLSQRTQVIEVKKMSTDGEQTSKEIIRIHRSLENAFAQNNNQPVGFFLFAIHPTLFSRSVENIFHLSFLIKEGKVELLLDEDQLPVLRPVQHSSDSPSNTAKTDQMHSLTQLILSLDMEQWESLIQVFHISKPMIED